jgi:hypothetical protein
LILHGWIIELFCRGAEIVRIFDRIPLGVKFSFLGSKDHGENFLNFSARLEGPFEIQTIN